MNNPISKEQVRKLWITAQGLQAKPIFGTGPKAVSTAVKQLGYVQIDTINVIERCHHHILYSRIPNYHQSHLFKAQSDEKSVFEYWTHALAYIPTDDYRYFLNDMKQFEKEGHPWYRSVKKEDLQKYLKQIKKDGALTIRDVTDDVLVEKDHEWGSKKPSKKVLQYGFYSGKLAISERIGMLKKYDLADRHFNWDKKPKAATKKEILEYTLNRALKAQVVVSLDSICHLYPKQKKEIHGLIEKKVKSDELIQVHVEGTEKVHHWMPTSDYNQKIKFENSKAHLLSPFDPLTIQRKRLKMFFDYDHRFEAYIPKEKRIYGYFALPILVDDQIVAVIDLKTDRQKNKLLVQQWTWLNKHKSSTNKKLIETELTQFEKFQLQK